MNKVLIKKSQGFGLFHLVVSGLLFSLVLSVGFPLLYSYMQFTRLHGASSTMTTALITSRIDAVNHNRPVVLCSSFDGRRCDNSGVWEQGFISFIDEDMNGRMSDAEQALKIYPALNNGATIRSDFPDSHQVVYLPSGRVKSTDKFNVCINALAKSGRSIDINITGRPQPKSGAHQCPGETAQDPSGFIAQN